MPAKAGTQGNWIDLCPLGPRFRGGDEKENGNHIFTGPTTGKAGQVRH